MSGRPRLEVTGLSKVFGANNALRGVSLSVAPGEIHGLVGENGSGKSTLVKILSGYHSPDAGSVLIDGEPIGLPVTPPDMRRLGLSVVHQDLGLVEGFSVVENLRLGSFAARRWTRAIDWERERENARAALEALGQEIDPDAPVAELRAAERASVAIARALQHHKPGLGVVMFDESSRALPRDALAHFHGLVRDVAARAGSVLFVGHRLEEVLELTDRVTVLRDGAVVETASSAELDEHRLIRLMLGRDLDQRPHVRLRSSSTRDTTVSAAGVFGALLRGIDLRIARGEIVGVTGLVGSGYEELPYLLCGARPAVAGSLTVDGARLDLSSCTPCEFLKARVALVPEDRAFAGLALELSLLENVTIPRARTRGSRLRLGSAWQREEAEWVIRELGVRPPVAALPVGHLSGGNQQKVLLGKWLKGEPRLLVMHEPTQGVDVGAHRDILEVIGNAAADGCAVLFAGIDASELAALCDRVLIIREGQVARELVGSDVSFDRIVDAMYGVGSLSAYA